VGKLPAFQFYPGDWRKDPGIQSLDYFDRGVWFEIMCFMHESTERGVLLLNGRPMTDDSLARLLGLDNQKLSSTLTRLMESGVAHRRDDGAIFNRRMIRDEQIRYIRAEAGKRGGNPNLLNQKSTTQVIQKPTPSSSSSSSSSDNIKEKKMFNRKRPKHEQPYREYLETDFNFGPKWKAGGKQALKRWVEYKSALGKPCLRISYQAHVDKYLNDPRRFNDLVDRAIRKGWQGINEEIPFGDAPTHQGLIKTPTPRAYHLPNGDNELVKQPAISEAEKIEARELIRKQFPMAYESEE